MKKRLPSYTQESICTYNFRYNTKKGVNFRYNTKKGVNFRYNTKKGVNFRYNTKKGVPTHTHSILYVHIQHKYDLQIHHEEGSAYIHTRMYMYV